MTSPYLERPLRKKEEIPPRKELWPYEAGAEPPKFLTKDKADE